MVKKREMRSEHAKRESIELIGEMKTMKMNPQSCARLRLRLMTSRANGVPLEKLCRINDIMSTFKKCKLFIYKDLIARGILSHSYGLETGKNGIYRTLKGFLGVLRGKKGLKTGLNGKRKNATLLKGDTYGG